MKQLLDFLPLLVFFAVYKFYDIYMATGALIAATAVQLVVSYLLYKKIEKMHLFTFALVAVFGSLTMVLQDEAFIKWKVTVVYGLFAIALLVGEIIKKPIIKSMLGNELPVPEPIWKRVSWAWIGFFSFCGALNVYVAFSLPLETWVNFKVFGLMGLTLAFTVLTVVYLFKHLPEDKKKELK
ncbi:septation protein A [Paraferrimonas sedimenticola]|uniref:Inner membrane-spanning protein YciB n=1 Tax=Paraferrimonas sedimenticola TaxID=375674 RepID=A0AA37VWN3_9GAMM|nr:septation protein A [Paraferrimonas sedimenticola]GLP94930.1 putative intracellular septation protein A [Paraferrimonas sedimenticola]